VPDDPAIEMLVTAPRNDLDVRRAHASELADERRKPVAECEIKVNAHGPGAPRCRRGKRPP
jgi:hypothetical protein